MKIIKPAKIPVLTRVLERHHHQLQFHVAAMIAFPLDAPRALADELSFWAAVSTALGSQGIIDEGFAKSQGEVLVAGHFHARQPIGASYVRAKVGVVDKRLAVLGDRSWRDGVPTQPEPTASMPIDWAHAFGGPKFDRNPYGKGVENRADGGHPLPNVEHFGALLRAPTERPEPAGFMPMDVTFEQRRRRAGTYDRRWYEDHFPGMAPDAEPTFFNAAPEDQWLEGFFRGDEEFLIENMHASKPRIEGRLPGLLTRTFVTHRKPDGEVFAEVRMRCDTVWLLPSVDLGVVIFHGSLPVSEDDAADIVHLVVACEEPGATRTVDHYQATLARRLDKDKGAIAGLSDSDLMPPRSSGVAPNIGELDVGRWVKSENIARQNMRRGQERRYAEMRTRLEAQGLDPKDYGIADLPPEPEIPSADDLDALAAFMERQLESSHAAQDEMTSFEGKIEEGRQKAREAYANIGENIDDILEQTSKGAGGPPKFSAASHLKTLEDMAAEARASSIPLVEIEQQLLSSDFRRQLEEQEDGLRDMYRRSAHLQPAASAMDPEASARTRVLVELALATGESLAGHDFTGAALAGMKMSGIDLSGALLEGADLSGCNLSNANLEGAVLARANLSGADLRGARLRGVNLGAATLCDAVLERVDLTDGVLSHAKLAGARFDGAELTGVDWLEMQPGAVDLSGTTMQQCIFIKADLCGVRFMAADLSEATFIECTLDDADFSQANLHKATFVRCRGERVSFREATLRQGVFVDESTFPEADFSDADMERVNLRGTVLSGASFDRAKLDGADLSECDASSASFERIMFRRGLAIRTKLEGASLKGANLTDLLASKARLAGADFTGANLYRADFSLVRGDAKTSFAEAELGRVRHLPKYRPSQGNE